MTTTEAPPEAQSEALSEALLVAAPEARPAPPWRRDFRLLWIGEATSKLGSAVTGVAFALVAVVTLQASTFTMGVLNATAWLPWLLIGLPAGAWIDRLARRRTMLVCDAISVLLFVSIPIAAWFGLLTIGQLVVVSLAAGTTSMFFSTAYQAYLPSLVPKEHLASANARLQGTEQVANLAGPGIAGVLTQTIGAVTGLLVDAASFLISALCLLGIRTTEPPPKARERNTTLREEIGEGLRFVGRDRYLRVLAISAAVDNLTLNGVYALIVVFLIRDVGAPPAAVGFVLAADFVGGLLGAAVASRVASRFGSARALLLASIGTAPFGLLIPLASGGAGLAYFVVGMLIPSMGMVIGNVITSGFRQAYCPPELRGRMFTSSRFIQFGIIPVGALIGGALGTVIGVRPALWILLAAVALGKLVRLVGPIKTNRDFPTEPDAPAAAPPTAPSAAPPVA